jgi:hypothetical protein
MKSFDMFVHFVPASLLESIAFLTLSVDIAFVELGSRVGSGYEVARISLGEVCEASARTTLEYLLVSRGTETIAEAYVLGEPSPRTLFVPIDWTRLGLGLGAFVPDEILFVVGHYLNVKGFVFCGLFRTLYP